jgi:ATP synthase protein I
LPESTNGTPDDAALQARLTALGRSLDGGRESQEAPPPAEDTTLASAMSLGARVLTEFVAGIGVGAVIGWQLDKWLKTSPVFLIVFLTLGTAAGFWNVYRIAAKPSARRNKPGPL